MSSFECPICTEVGEGVSSFCMVQDCGHVFHEKCINQWFNGGSRNCPTCRKIVKRTWKLYGTLSTNAPEAINITDDVNTPYTRRLEKEIKELQESFFARGEDLELEINRSDHTERLLTQEKKKTKDLTKQNGDLTKQVNELNFKLSMYEEFFGPDTNKVFTKLIQDARDN